MNVHLLIDAVVRQTTVLLAQLATAGGARASLSHTANQVFVELTSELRRQGLNNKLIADLFGLSLRTYHNKVRRLSESRTDRGRPLWNAVADFIQSQSAVSRADVLRRFCRDEDTLVRSVLLDLVEAGVVFTKGRGDSVYYRAASNEELAWSEQSPEEDTLDTLLWVLVARHSPITQLELQDLAQRSPREAADSLARLLADDRVERSESADGTVRYSSAECIIAQDQGLGWEASVFDHYQAVVAAICAKLASGKSRSVRGELVGGSTYSFEVWSGHPLHDEATSLLQKLRDTAAQFRARVDELAPRVERPSSGVVRFVTYVGQNVVALDDATEVES
jgi:hypothetical protein